MNEKHTISKFNIPTIGTRFTYTRYRNFISDEVVEYWSGTVWRHHIDNIAEHVVLTKRDDTDEFVWFWNSSFAGTDTEKIEIVSSIEVQNERE
jgi:hypothetical protein